MAQGVLVLWLPGHDLESLCVGTGPGLHWQGGCGWRGMVFGLLCLCQLGPHWLGQLGAWSASLLCGCWLDLDW